MGRVKMMMRTWLGSRVGSDRQMVWRVVGELADKLDG